MPLTDYLPYFQIAGQVSLVVGVLFAGYQLVQAERGRKEAAAIQVITSLQDQAFRDAFAHVWTLPLGASAEEVRKRGPEMEHAAMAVMMSFETMGVLVHNRIVPLDVVDQVIGGFARESWRRLEHYVKWKRQDVGSPRWGEWYQWLFEHMATNPRRNVGAYEAFRDWRPEPWARLGPRKP